MFDKLFLILSRISLLILSSYISYITILKRLHIKYENSKESNMSCTFEFTIRILKHVRIYHYDTSRFAKK
jgi:hypothetical protein